jgi:GDP-4-dehydro-6-deoxy-D-mannose reductase
VGDLTASRDFTFVADVVEAYVALVEKDVPEGVYNICSGKARTMQEILDELLSFSTVQISVKKDEARMRPSEVPFFVGDYGKSKKATGWAPRYDFHQGMKETLDYWRNH